MFRYIYRYRNKLNGKVYIGQTIDIERRKSEHLKDAERGTGFVFHYKVDAVCECCGAPFRADKYAVAKGKGRFCSRRCARVSRG